ncbi:uncharacterized protein LOC121862701 [Homarus americanus]|uniref:uncharacterized protein LOC121862701 n=1 Tax=Homarus americanus TaxID=6706 RepID=UPI001C46C97A|nr:uncharacterized protein LOC121862701 [Homarus americanus]
MKSTWLCGAAVVVGMTLALCSLTSPADAYVTAFPDEPDIDGKLITVGFAVAKFLAGLVPYPTVSALLLAIINAWEPKPEDNYWEHVKDNVAEMCGEFINEHNFHQVEIYKEDLMSLLSKYTRADAVSDGTYPDKNTVADAITTSIITNRFLVEASERPWSLTVDFVDIASVHITILKDAADSYTQVGGEISRWWVDLSRQLKHYIEYGVYLEHETLKWRNTQIECYFDEGNCGAPGSESKTCYDIYRITDNVKGYTETCKQIHPAHKEDGACAKFCDLYQTKVDFESVRWLNLNLDAMLDEWSFLKQRADALAKKASQYYNPLTKDL